MSPNVRVVAHFPYTSGGDIDFIGSRAYFTSASLTFGTVRVVDVGGKKPELVGEFQCGGTSTDISVVDESVIALGSHWGACPPFPTSGINLLDVSDPESVEPLGVWPIAGGSHTLAKHPTEPLIYTSAEGGFGGDPFEHIIDVSDPALPRLVGTMDENCHDRTFIEGRRTHLAFCAGGGATEIWDVTDPAAPSVLARIEDTGIGYHHRAVASSDGKYLVIADESLGATCSGKGSPREIGGLTIYDISDPSQPEMVNFINPPRGPAPCWAHNFNFVPGRRVLVASWRQAGTSVYDLANPRRPREIAFFHPDHAAVWGAYWYDGRVYVNSDSGGYVLEIKGA